MNLRILGLDLAPTATGIAATHNTHAEPGLVAYTVKPRNGADGHERVWDTTVAVAEACRMDPHLAVVEGLYVGHHNNTLELAGLHWYVRQWLWHSGIPYVQVAPQTRAVYATGDGRADKETVLREVQRTYTALYVRSTHEADALVLAAMACDHYGQPLAELPDTHRRALAAVRWPDLMVAGNPVSGGGCVC